MPLFTNRFGPTTQVLLPATPSAALAKGRESWLYFTVPETPVAGAPVVVYFNRSQSEPLM